MQVRRAFQHRAVSVLADGAIALGSLDIAGAVSVGTNVVVTGNTTIGGGANVQGDLDVFGYIEIPTDGVNPRIRGRTDTNTGIGLPSADTLTLFTGGVANASLSSAGALDALGGVTGQGQFFPPGVDASGGPLTMVAGKAYAYYVGQAPRNLTAMDLHCYIHGVAAVAGGGGAALNWAEVAIASGPKPSSLQANVNLTVLAYASIDTEAKAGATTLVSKAVSAFSLARDLGMWVVVAASYQTTQASLRFSNGSDVTGLLRTRSACQPSANINAPLAFATAAPTGATVPWVRLQLP